MHSNESCRNVRASIIPHKLFTGVKPTVKHLQSLGGKEWIRVSDKKRKFLEAIARTRILLCSIPYGKYRDMMKSDRIIHISWHCIVEEYTSPTKKSTSNARFNKQGNAYGAEGISNDREVFIEGEYEYSPLVIRPVLTAQQGQNENAPSNDSSEEETWNVQSLTARRSTR